MRFFLLKVQDGGLFLRSKANETSALVVDL